MVPEQLPPARLPATIVSPRLSVPLSFWNAPPMYAEPPKTVLLVIVVVPSLARAPPTSVAKLLASVLLSTVIVPKLKIAPPRSAELPERVLAVMPAVPRL
jgi:hypothetical protein